MSYTNIVREISHISEENILKNTKKDIFLAFKEAFNNSLEAIKDNNLPHKNYKDGQIIISVYSKHNISGDEIFDFLTIEDNGTGITPDGFKRFCQYINSSKGYNNKGTGRFFLLKSFKKSIYNTIYKKDNKYQNVCFDFSQNNSSKNLYINVLNEKEINTSHSKTLLSLYPFDASVEDIDEYKYFLDINYIKKSIVEKFLLEFVLYSETGIPNIVINKYNECNELIDSIIIDASDIPSIDTKDNIYVNFCKINYNNRCIEKIEEQAKFDLYIAKSSNIDKNQIILTCNNQNTESLSFYDLLPTDTLSNDDRILLFVKSEYLDNPQLINNERQEFYLTNKSDIEKKLRKKNASQTDFNFSNEKYIFKDDIEKKINYKVADIYPEIKQLKEQKDNTAQKLKNRFLISDGVFEKVTKKMNINTSPEDFLIEFYKAEAEILAKTDITISNKIDEVMSIDTSKYGYLDTIDRLSTEIVKLIPLQNRNSLAQYIARRKLVLKAFDNILNHMEYSEVKEKHLHNLFLTKTTDNTYDDSNLWMLNEDFIYFTGRSEEQLCNFKIDGINVFKSDFNEEEERYLKSLGENRKIKRPDILLFPEENKCIIIEFKNIDVNVSDHLSQINKYAYWLRNYSNDCFKFTQFFGYLIGEAIEPKDVRAADGEFKTMYHGRGLFKPKSTIPCDNNQNLDGELYMEVLPYSELLKRANTRNKIFIEKLGLDYIDNKDIK